MCGIILSELNEVLLFQTIKLRKKETTIEIKINEIRETTYETKLQNDFCCYLDHLFFIVLQHYDIYKAKGLDIDQTN